MLAFMEALSPAVNIPDGPRTDDRILVLKWHWLDLMLQRVKTLEIRGRRLKAGGRRLETEGGRRPEAD